MQEDTFDAIKHNDITDADANPHLGCNVDVCYIFVASRESNDQHNLCLAPRHSLFADALNSSCPQYI